MTLNISQLHNEGYHHAVTLNLQQKCSKLASCVRNETQSVEKYFYDKIAPTEAIYIIGRHSDTPLIETKFDRRMISLITSNWADLIDREDKLKVIHDPTKAYALNAAYALGRKKDDRIIKAALGNALTGNKGDTTVALPDNQKIALTYSYDKPTDPSKAIKSSLTLDKLRMARFLLDDAEEQFCIVTSKQIAELLRSTEATSIDYNTVRSLVKGRINTFMGFTFKRVSSILLPINQDKVRSIICYAKSGLLLATAEDIKTDISIRKDKNMAVQVYASLSCGATRMDEKKVVEILCQE